MVHTRVDGRNEETKRREPKFKSVSVESKECARLSAEKKCEFQHNLFEDWSETSREKGTCNDFFRKIIITVDWKPAIYSLFVQAERN